MFEYVPDSSITFNIPTKLLIPEGGIGLRTVGNLAPLMPMPKASMDKDGEPMPPEYDVRLAREPIVIEPIAQAKPMKGMPQGHFWPRVL